MAPLFMNLTFWIGAFMLLVIMRQEADGEGIPGLTLAQRYWGRYLFLAAIAVMQAVICCVGVLALGVQTVSAPALIFAAALASLAYLSIIYAFSVTLQHIGKGICVVLVFAQIPGATGLYPIEMTSPFFQSIYPLFPFTYGIGAMREAICGFYGGQYVSDLLVLALFLVLFMALGLLIRPLMANVNRMVARQVRDGGLFNGEDVDIPVRPYRISQIMRALSDKDTYATALQQRYATFNRWYPRLMKGALVLGVAVPVAGGTLLYSFFYGFSALGSQEFYRALFIGTIMTATSVSITVATLQELGHLKSFLGTTIVSAAVIDDVIGIVVLTCVLGASSGTGTGLGKVLMNTVLFFATAIGVGLIAHFAMKWLDKRNPHTQRITIVSMAFCFAMAYIAEAYFGIADITGAYIAGIVLCTLEDAPYVERRVDISNYVLFAPIFFASIGLKTDISGLTPEILLFSVCFVVVALITKIIGCGLAAKICRFSWGDSLKVGVGMMTRGEVALIVAQKGLDIGVVDSVYFTAVILLIVVSSVATPLVLKALFTKMPVQPHPSQAKQ